MDSLTPIRMDDLRALATRANDAGLPGGPYRFFGRIHRFTHATSDPAGLIALTLPIKHDLAVSTVTRKVWRLTTDTPANIADWVEETAQFLVFPTIYTMTFPAGSLGLVIQDSENGVAKIWWRVGNSYSVNSRLHEMERMVANLINQRTAGGLRGHQKMEALLFEPWHVFQPASRRQILAIDPVAIFSGEPRGFVHYTLIEPTYILPPTRYPWVDGFPITGFKIETSGPGVFEGNLYCDVVDPNAGTTPMTFNASVGTVDVVSINGSNVAIWRLDGVAFSGGEATVQVASLSIIRPNRSYEFGDSTFTGLNTRRFRFKRTFAAFQEMDGLCMETPMRSCPLGSRLWASHLPGANGWAGAGGYDSTSGPGDSTVAEGEPSGSNAGGVFPYVPAFEAILDPESEWPVRASVIGKTAPPVFDTNYPHGREQLGTDNYYPAPRNVRTSPAQGGGIAGLRPEQLTCKQWPVKRHDAGPPWTWTPTANPASDGIEANFALRWICVARLPQSDGIYSTLDAVDYELGSMREQGTVFVPFYTGTVRAGAISDRVSRPIPIACGPQWPFLVYRSVEPLNIQAIPDGASSNYFYGYTLDPAIYPARGSYLNTLGRAPFYNWLWSVMGQL